MDESFVVNPEMMVVVTRCTYATILSLLIHDTSCQSRLMGRIQGFQCTMDWYPFIFFISLFVFSASFNLDSHFPIVIHDALDGPNSHFGASLTLLDLGWVMIGAPKANSSGGNYTHIKQPGVVWRCRVGPGPKDCRLAQMDPAGNMDVKVERVQFELVHLDRKDNGMLGAAMAWGGSERFVACASRWVNQKYANRHLMNGICYWVEKNNLLSNSPNETWPWISSGLSYRLTPLLNRSRQAYTVPTNPPKVPPQIIFDWGVGQAGFSLHLSKNNDLVLGAPGILDWTGSVIRFKDTRKQPFKNIVVARAQLQPVKNILQYFDYFGYSVTGGNFFRETDGQVQYASGAPRSASLCGKILVFTFNDAEGLTLLVEPIEGGNGHFGSYFGSTLVAVDTNGDGFDELLVGAPLYKSTQGHVGSLEESNGRGGSSTSSSGDEGCVFIYISNGERFRSAPIEICGENRAGGRFGSAMSVLGDLNMDGFQDVAIGAPYEREGRGAVYIYHGSRTGLSLAQKLNPQEIDDSLRGFGYALSPGVDVDNNSYPDVAVGSASSNHVVIFRTIPVVNITGNLSSSVTKLMTNTGKFQVISCLSFNGVNVPNSRQIVLKLILDTEVRKQRIAEFDVNSDSESKDSPNMVLRTNSYEKSGTCFTFEANVIGDLDLVTLPLSIRQEFALLAQPPESLHVKPLAYQIQKSPGGTPHLQQTGNLDALYEDFEQKWPLPMSNVLGITRLSVPIGAICEDDGDPTCLASLNLKALLRTPDGDIHTEEAGNEFLIGSYRSISLEVELTNIRETANLPLTVTISWKSPPTVRSSRSDCSRHNEELGGNEQIYICHLRNPLTRNKKVADELIEVVELELDMPSIFADRKFLHFELSANTSSALTADPTTIFSPPLKTKSEVVVFGQLSDAPYYENMTVESINFTHTFEVGMNGASPIASVQMEFLIPRDVEINGELVELLRIREPISTYDGNKLRCSATNGVFYVDSTSTSVREENDIEGLSDGELQRAGRPKRSKTKLSPRVRSKPSFLMLNCTMTGIFCFRVTCEAHRFRPTSRAVVEFRLRLVTKTARALFMEVSDREVIIIESEARLIGANSEGQKFGKQMKGFSKTLLKVQPPQEIEAWILILSFVGGLILLTFIALLLVQCGFFRRTKKEELYALRTEQEMTETFGYPPDAQYDEYPKEFLPNYDYEEIYDYPHDLDDQVELEFDD